MGMTVVNGVTEQTQMRPGYRSPPHSREAEESVIGAVLLSEDAVNEVMDRIHPEDFYVPAHLVPCRSALESRLVRRCRLTFRRIRSPYYGRCRGLE